MVGSMRTLSDGHLIQAMALTAIYDGQTDRQTDWQCWLHKDSRRVLIIGYTQFDIWYLRVQDSFCECRFRVLLEGNLVYLLAKKRTVDRIFMTILEKNIKPYIVTHNKVTKRENDHRRLRNWVTNSWDTTHRRRSLKLEEISHNMVNILQHKFPHMHDSWTHFNNFAWFSFHQFLVGFLFCVLVFTYFYFLWFGILSHWTRVWPWYCFNFLL